MYEEFEQLLAEAEYRLNAVLRFRGESLKSYHASFFKAAMERLKQRAEGVADGTKKEA